MGDSREASGLGAVLQLLGAAGRLGDGGDDAADLFEAPAPLPLPLARPASGGKGGRPKGARNKSTEEWARFLLSQYRSPLTVLADLYSRPTSELVDQLQEMAKRHRTWRETKDGGYWEQVAISPLDVLKVQRDAAVALAPYVHKRQPMAIEVDERPPGIVILGELSAAGGEPVDDLALPLAPIEDYQEVTGAPAEASDEQSSDDHGRSRPINGLRGDDV